ncbi:MAG: hypothetical protein CFH08_00579 [Alphaproteobacteria bacterium MarineAlpha3_Bin7]|nr:MAG: hypothetical protein CFH08_00579 [Alphaproteobacteria bacterium MarineAlpha3_Bin7]|tara:strand:+ start:238 stop:1221 length:984 start_codon:yes stop_codon:yes gene_type:complete
MKGKIGLEEHFAIDETISDSVGFLDDKVWPKLKENLLDFREKRIGIMDQYNIQMMILSLNAPAVQAIHEPKRAIEISVRSNDVLAEEVNRLPDRFAGLAALPMQSPEVAIEELERCVKDLGFIGILVNGFSQIDDPESAVYLDLPQYRDFWKKVEELDVPFYLHPRNPLPSDARIYDGHPWLLGPTWAFGQETAVHALRLMCSGLFDDFPNLKIILGHMGEGLPFNLWRVDNRNAWVNESPSYPAKKTISHYFQENFYITTSGNFSTPALLTTMLEVGVDRILFSTDYPFEAVSHAANWFDNLDISENDMKKIGRENSKMLFKLNID